MISGFSNMHSDDSSNHSFGGASSLPVPFNIPKVFFALLNHDVDLNLSRKQSDLIETLKFAHDSRETMLKRLQEEELEIRPLMMEGDGIAKQRYDEINMEKLEGFEHYLELIEAVAEILEPEQYKILLESVGIKSN